ncbi:hypothetical protein [Microbacterium testaceum]|nr:hypothetical protein [Microbacterium testaceum]
MGKIKLTNPQPNYLERAVEDPDQAMKRARAQVRADRKRRERYLITAAVR